MRHFLIHYDSFTKLKWLCAITAELTFTLGVKLIQSNTFCVMTTIYHHSHNILNTVKKLVYLPKVRISKQL
jgi:hypothetical protein